MSFSLLSQETKEIKPTESKAAQVKKAIKKFKGYKTSFNVGLGVGHQTDLYKSGNASFPVIPIVGFKYKNFFGYGINYGYTFFWSWPTLSFTIKPELLSLRPEAGTITEGLRPRNITLNGGIKAIFPTKKFIATIDVVHDIFNRYGSYQIGVDLNKPIRLSKKFNLIAGLGLDFVSRGYTDYYFGVSQSEVNLAPNINRPYFEGKSAIKAKAQFVLIYELSQKTALVLINEFTHLPSEISESPLVKSNYLNRFYATITYSF